jgi:SAM-dependent methyltransferase
MGGERRLDGAVRVHDLSACPACGSPDGLTFLLGESDLKRCRACSHVYAPRYADPEDVYVDGYMTGGRPDFGVDVRNDNFQQWLSYVAHRRMALVERHVRPPATLLDVGCGTGEVLLAARSRGWTVHGVEPVVESAAMARDTRGLDVRCAVLEESGFAEHSFDVVCAIHVLEHMTDAVNFIRMIARWARPGGLVFIEVPNWRSLDRRSAGASWGLLRPLEHLSHFSPASLTHTMQRAGLNRVRARTPSFLWSEQSFDQVVSDLGLGSQRRRLGRLGKPGLQFGTPEVMPTQAGWVAFRGLSAAYALARVGKVINASGRAV